MTITAGALLGRVLRAAGVAAVYGEVLPGLPVVTVRDREVARLLAAAHHRVHRRRALVHAGGVLGGHGDPLDLAAAGDLLDAVGHLANGGAVRLVLDLESGAPDVVPLAFVADRWLEPGDDALDALRRAERPIVLAGPGVVDAVAGLHALAAAGSLGVLNTWGAKGVFDWRSRHHLATAGLQARDFELGGVTSADLVVATGVDPLEAPPDRWQAGQAVVEVAPGALDRMAEAWSRPGQPIEVPPLRAGLAAVTQEGWASTDSPMAPTAATRNLATVLAGGGLVAADPGAAGYWVARTFATTELGAVVVPAGADAEGFAVACALVARRRDPKRAVLAVVDGPPRARVLAVLDTAEELGIPIPVEVWRADGDALDPNAHLARLRRLVHATRPALETLALDPAQLARMVEVAGPVVAWGGLPSA